MATLQELARRAKRLPEPHRTNALANVKDAWDDLVDHPLHRHRILADLKRAIEAHETEAAVGEEA
jgi:hypothetical protein